MKFCLSLCLFLCFKQVNAQTWVTIPDANLVTYLQSIIPAAMNGNQLNTSSPLVTTTTYSLHIPINSIANLYGIQYFTSLTYLNCSQNPNPGGPTPNTFTVIPTLPNTLIYLDCSGNYNNLQSIPVLPNTLQTLYCSFDSHLTGLPNLPNSLTLLDCASCSIHCFPTFPNSITSLNIEYNSFNCLPNYLSCMDSVTLSYPLCAAGNSNGCPIAIAGIGTYSNNKVHVNIYPNPNYENFIIEGNSSADRQSLQVYDVNGKVVLNQNINGKTSIDATNLNSGVYFIHITDENGVTIKNDKLVLMGQ
jgi:hypothetical protein